MTTSRHLVLLIAAFIPILFTGCYKKELEEFKKVDFESPKSFAFPLFESTITLKDSLPFTFEKVNLSDTVEIDLSPGSLLGNSFGKFDYVEFKFILKNNFSAQGEIQFYFTDSGGKIVDSLLTNNTVIEAANGIGFNEKTILIYVDKEKFRKIEKSPKIYIRYSLVSDISNLYAANQIQIHSGIKFGTTF